MKLNEIQMWDVTENQFEKKNLKEPELLGQKFLITLYKAVSYDEYFLFFFVLDSNEFLDFLRQNYSAGGERRILLS